MELNFVDSHYKYGMVMSKTTDKMLTTFCNIMDMVEHNCIEVNKQYSSKDLSDIMNSNVQSATLTGLVKRGLLYCDGKFINGTAKGRNCYMITDEIWNYYITIFKPSMDDYNKWYLGIWG